MIKEPDAHATPEQRAILDRAVAILDVVNGDDSLVDHVSCGKPIPPEHQEEWKAIGCDLRDTIEDYGCEFIHMGWNIVVHGHKVLTARWTDEVAKAREEFFERLMDPAQRPKFRQGKSIPIKENQ